MILFWISMCFHFRGVYVHLYIYIYILYMIHTYHGCSTYPSPHVSPPSSWLFKNSLIAMRGQSSQRSDLGMLDEGTVAMGAKRWDTRTNGRATRGWPLYVHMYQILLKSRWLATPMVYHGPENLQIATFYLGGGDRHLLSLWCNRHNLRESFKEASYCTYWPFEFASFCASHRCLWPFHPFLPSPALSPILFWYGTIELLLLMEDIPNNHLGCIKPCK